MNKAYKRKKGMPLSDEYLDEVKATIMEAFHPPKYPTPIKEYLTGAMMLEDLLDEIYRLKGLLDRDTDG